MEIKVFSLAKAVKYEAPKPTYVISVREDLSHYFDNELKDLYTKLDENFTKQELITVNRCTLPDLNIPEDVLESIIVDFNNKGRNKEIFLAHCHGGRTRSPTIAKALNQIFHLNQNPQEFLPENYIPDPFLYESLIRSAERLNLVL